MRHPLPTIDPTRHLPLDLLARRFDGLAPPPTDQGRVTLLHARAEDRMRVTPARVWLDHDGMPEDAWSRDPDRRPEAQLAVMSHPIGALIANGQSFTLFGDNLVLDLDLSEANLPVDSQLAIGGAMLQVTPKAHTGCSLYAQRFGLEALQFISAPARRPLRLRGLYLQVVQPGEVAVGDPVDVVRRGA